MKYVTSTQGSNKEMTAHLTISACTTREMTSTFGSSIFPIWIVTSQPILPTVFIYLNWWDMHGFAHPRRTSYTDSVKSRHVFIGKVSNLHFYSARLQNSSTVMVRLLVSLIPHCESWEPPSTNKRHWRILFIYLFICNHFNFLYHLHLII